MNLNRVIFKFKYKYLLKAQLLQQILNSICGSENIITYKVLKLCISKTTKWWACKYSDLLGF